jgi:hypothetical protein
MSAVRQDLPPSMPGHRRGSRPVVAVLATRWESRSEEGWITRQVAGALACAADVHVITPEGDVAGTSVDSVFSLHRLASPVDPLAEVGRDLLIEGLSASTAVDGTGVPDEVAGLIDRGLVEPWRDATEVLSTVGPDLIVIAGHQNVGALTAVDRGSLEAEQVLLALASDDDAVAFPHFDHIVERCTSVLTVTESERSSIADHHGNPDKVHRIGAPLSANSSVLGEPNTWVGDNETIVVVTDVATDSDHEETELARLVRLQFPDNPVGVIHTDAFDAWHQGRLNRGWAVQRSSDLARLMAWARVTVDLHPGRLFARGSVDSLLYGTPIVVPAHSRAREHAARGRGGLWFDNPAELTWCIEALLDSPVHDSLARQGRAYAAEEYGSTERFIERVVDSCGLTSAAVPARITA